MDNNVQYLLQNLLNEHGIDIIHKPFQLDALLREQAKGQFSVEIYLLALSAAAGVVDQLLLKDSSSLKPLVSTLSLHLHQHFGMDESSASWVIDSWIAALNFNVPVVHLTTTAISKTRAHFSERNHQSDIFFNVEQTTKQLAVLFADICSSTTLYETIGDDLARHFTALCIKLMIKAIKPYQGTLIKTIGDEIMCTFPSAELALNAACTMQKAVKRGMANLKQHLSIRIGFHYGSVICEANDVFGDTVNVAARVAGFAKAEQIMTTDAVYAKLPAELQEKTKPFKSISLKGKQEQCEIYWVLWKEHQEQPAQFVPAVQHHVTSPYRQVILKYIPQNTTHRQILQFVKPALDGGLFSKSGTIERVSVLVHKHQLSDAMDFHIILAIQPDEVAKRVIDKLHRKQLNGRYIAVAEYVERSIYNNSSVIYTKDEHPKANCVPDRRDSTKRVRLISIEQLKDFIWTN
jgi:class 3 adenylate cyclase